MFKSLLMFGASMSALAATGADAATFMFTGQRTSYTVETTGLYDIAAFGAAGGSNQRNSGGAGASASGRVNLTAGTVLDILVGGVGSRGQESFSPGGGGGATFVLLSATNALAVAGGGGGAGYRDAGQDGLSFNGPGGGGIGGFGYYGGGGGGSGVSSNGGSGGGGYHGAGSGGMAPDVGGFGGAGGEGGGTGGFGGGGGGGLFGGGGGGGFLGGDGDSYVGGGGGSSFLRSGPSGTTTVTNQVYGLNTAGAAGRFDINLVTPVVAAVPEPESWLTMILGSGFVGLLLRRRQRKGLVQA